MKKQTVLCILDGYGLSDRKDGNAVAMANKPHIDKIFKEYNQVTGNASGEFVGLPNGQMGNSEVGHLNIGAGRIIYQDLTRISKSISDGDFFKNEKILECVNHVKNNNSNIHIMGLLSNGGVHSHNTHLYALLKLFKENNINNVYIHCFLDGRDTPPKSSVEFLKELENKMKNIGVGKIVSLVGRYYAMDRDKNYDRTKLAYDLLVSGGGKMEIDAVEAINKSYDENITDEFVNPTVISDGDKNFGRINDNDSIIFFNFRPDRARQITRAFVDDDFQFFDRKKINNIKFLCFTDYDETIKNKLVAFEDIKISNTIAEIISKNNLKQLHIAETEKYAHVTFFLNGGIEEPFPNEERILIPSPKDVKTYDEKPEMSAEKVCENVVNAIKEEKYDFIVVNFANPDMVGHTGKLDATIKAIEKIDNCVGRIFDAIVDKKANLFICADHGNSEVIITENGEINTAHTTNPVPFCLVTENKLKIKDGGSLCDIAPTLLNLMNIKIPNEMTGKSLII